MTDRLVTPPEGSAVSLELAKKHLVIEHSADDALIEQQIAAATKYAENFCNRAILEQTWEAIFPGFPPNHCAPELRHCTPPSWDSYLELKRGNLILDGLAVSYYDAAGVNQTLAGAGYSVDDASLPGRIRLAPNASWPTTQARWDAVRVTYTVGWAEDDVPAPIVQALLLLISQMYENRTPEITGSIVSSIKFSFDALLSQFRIYAL